MPSQKQPLTKNPSDYSLEVQLPFDNFKKICDMAGLDLSGHQYANDDFSIIAIANPMNYQIWCILSSNKSAVVIPYDVKFEFSSPGIKLGFIMAFGEYLSL